jgi:Histone deacetylase domain
VVDIDVHFGNGTAELLRGDPRAFFASVHMIYGDENSGSSEEKKQGPRSNEEESSGFYPSLLGTTEVTDTYVSVGVFPPLPSTKGERNYFGRNPAASRESKEIKIERVSSGDSLAMVIESSGSSSSSNKVSKDPQHCDSDATAVSSVHDSGTVQPVTPSSRTPSSNQGDREKVKEGGREHPSSETKSHSTPGAKRGPLGDFRGVAGFRRALSDVIIPQVKHSELFVSCDKSASHS